MRRIFLMFILCFINQTQSAFAQDSILNSSHIIKLNTSDSSPHYIFEAKVKTDYLSEDSCESIIISFQKRPYLKDTFIVVIPQSDSGRFSTVIASVRESEITNIETPLNLIKEIDVYESGESCTIIKKKQHIIKLELYYSPLKFNTPPNVYYMKFPLSLSHKKCKHSNGCRLDGGISHIPFFGSERYTPTELILRTVPGVPR
ncbi:MAG: hypothetical protein WC150_05385 [Bacteroidia bacterium]